MWFYVFCNNVRLVNWWFYLLFFFFVIYQVLYQFSFRMLDVWCFVRLFRIVDLFLFFRLLVLVCRVILFVRFVDGFCLSQGFIVRYFWFYLILISVCGGCIIFCLGIQILNFVRVGIVFLFLFFGCGGDFRKIFKFLVYIFYDVILQFFFVFLQRWNLFFIFFEVRFGYVMFWLMGYQ